MIDWTRISELRAELGQDDFEEVFEIFLGEVEDSVQSLAAAPTGPTLQAILHSVKGNALTVGFAALADLASAGEVRAASGEAVDLAAIKAVHVQSITAYTSGPHDA